MRIFIWILYLYHLNPFVSPSNSHYFISNHSKIHDFFFNTALNTHTHKNMHTTLSAFSVVCLYTYIEVISWGWMTYRELITEENSSLSSCLSLGGTLWDIFYTSCCVHSFLIIQIFVNNHIVEISLVHSPVMFRRHCFPTIFLVFWLMKLFFPIFYNVSWILCVGAVL